MSLKEREGVPKTHVQELEDKVKELSDELAQANRELTTARERAVKAEQERDALKTKKPETDPEVAKKLKAAEAENADLKRKVKEKDDLLLKAQSSLKKAGEDQEKLKAEAKTANEKAAAAEKRATEAEARAAEAEAKKPEAVAPVLEAEKIEIRLDLLTSAERDAYFEKRSQWAADDRAKAEAEARVAEARKEYLHDLAAKAAERR